MLGIYLQAYCVLSFFFSISISIIWFYTYHILLLLHQDTSIAESTALYIKYLILGVFGYGFLHNTSRVLQIQSIVQLLIHFSLLPLGIHFRIAYVLVYRTFLGFIGAPLAASISLWISLLLLGMYVNCEKKLKLTCERISFESFDFFSLINLKITLYSAALVGMEYWAFELLVVCAELVPNAQASIPVIAMRTRVSNELGAGIVKRAKYAMNMSLKLSTICGIAVVLALAFVHHILASSFSNNLEIINEFAALTPFLLISLSIDSCFIRGRKRMWVNFPDQYFSITRSEVKSGTQKPITNIAIPKIEEHYAG